MSEPLKEPPWNESDLLTDDDDDCCWRCHGEGGWHDCGEDCCPCADPEAFDENWIWCPECNGRSAL